VLYLDAPIGPLEGVSIFRDHADRGLFYYANTRPRLSRTNGVPEFVFLVYKRDITDNPNLSPDDKEQLGGGFLAFTVDLGLDDETLDTVRRQVANLTGEQVTLAAVPITKASVRLSITKDVADAPDAPAGTQRGVQFFEQVYGTTMPSILGDNRATFGVVLDHEGALLMRAALESGISPIGVIYTETYLGLRPAFNVKIHADYKRIYTSLEIEFGVKAAYGPIAVAADIDLAWQRLRDEGSIRVEVINFTDDADLRHQADSAFEWFKSQLLTDFFKSSLEPPSFMRQGQSAGLLGSLQQLLGPLVQPQQGASAPTMGQPTTAAPTPLPPPTSTDSNTQSTGERNRAATPAAAPAEGGGRGPQPGLGVQVGFSLKRIEQDELKTRDFEYSMQAAVSREMAPQGLFSTMVDGLDLSRAIKEVSLDSDFFKRINASFTLGADLAAEKISAVSVNVEYPGARPDGVQPSTVDGFTFTPADTAPKAFRTFLDDHLDMRYRYKIGVDFGSDSMWVGDEQHFDSDWVVTTDRSPQVNPFSAVDRFDLEVVVASDVRADEVNGVRVDLAYEDPVAGFSASQTYDFKPGDPSEHWRLRFGESRQKVYRYRITYLMPGNVRYGTSWVTSEPVTAEAGSLVINSPFRGQLALRVVPVLDPAQVIEADVALVYREDDTGYERRKVLTYTGGGGPMTSQAVQFPTLAADPAGVTATVTVVRADGSVFEGPPTKVPAETSVLPVSDGVGAVHRISVRLADADLAGAGLVAVRVRLDGVGDGADHAEVLFSLGQSGSATATLVQPLGGAPFEYLYEVIGYTRTGLPVEGATGRSSDTVLILALPRPA
jgi:hypothetical protein